MRYDKMRHEFNLMYASSINISWYHCYKCPKVSWRLIYVNVWNAEIHKWNTTHIWANRMPNTHLSILLLPFSLSHTCAFLADIGQLIVAGHVVPFAILMGDHHHTVLSSRKEIIRLVLPPVLILLQEAQEYFRHKQNPVNISCHTSSILQIHLQIEQMDLRPWI